MNRKGPFGLWMGMPLDALEGEKNEIAPSKYQVNSVPKSHSAFESYALLITPKCGLSWIKAIGHTKHTNIYGTDLITAFEDLEKKLSNAYGKGARRDFLMPDSIWNEPKDWMQALMIGERYLFTEWKAEHGSALTDSLLTVGLLPGALEVDSYYLSVEYIFENYASAEAELSAAEDDAL